jgi:hypothetical protein
MKKSLIAKAEAARKRVHATAKGPARSAQAARELRVAAKSMALASSIKPHLTLDELRAKATAASKQMRRG